MIRAIRSGLAVAAPPDGGRYAYRIDGDMRVVQVPSDAAVLGVEGDRNTNRVAFFLPREYRGTDLSEFDVQVSYVNAGGELGVYDAGKPTVEADGLSFDWLVEEPVVRYQGAVRFAAKLYQADERGTVLRQYSSTVGTAQCLEGLDVDAELPEDVTKSLIAQLTGMAEASAKRANEAASKAEAAADDANEAASRAAGSILRGEASGTLCHADDAFRAKPLGWTIYGRSVQDGTPSPDAPKPIASVTKADVSIAGKNLIKLTESDHLASNNGATYTLENDGVNVSFTREYSYVSFIIENRWGDAVLALSCDIENSAGKVSKIEVFGVDERLNSGGECLSSNNGASFSAKNHAYLRIVFYANPTGEAYEGSCAYANLMLEAAGKTDGFEPYGEPLTLPIELQGNELRGLPDGYRDEARFDADGGTFISRIGKAENLPFRANQFAISSSGKPFMTVPFEVFPKPSIPSNATVCDAFPYSAALHDAEIGCYRTWNAIIFFNAAWKDGEQAARELTELNLTVLCAVPDVQTIPLGKVAMPTLPAPVANAWVESDVPTECAVRYVRDMNVVIAKLEAKLAAVAGAVSMLDTPTVIPELAE